MCVLNSHCLRPQHIRCLGECFAASPPMALKELHLSCYGGYALEEADLAPFFAAIETGAAPLLERLDVWGAPITGDNFVTLCNAIEQGAFSKLK